MSKSSACPECRHILTSGRKCRAVALRGRPFCFQHSRQRSIVADGSCNSVKLPTLEDQASILVSLNQVIRAMTTNRLDHKAAGRCLYAIQLAMQTIRQIEAEPPFEQVTDYLDGRFGDTIAVTDEPRTPEDLYYLLSEYEKSHCSHGDKGWEPTNADYPDPEEKTEPVQPEPVQPEPAQSEPAQSEAVQPHSAQTQPAPAEPVPSVADTAPNYTPTTPATSASETSPATNIVTSSEPASDNSADAPPAEPAAPPPTQSNAVGPTGKSRPGGTREISPGRKSWVVNSNSSEVPKGRPNSTTANGAPRAFNGTPPDPSNATTSSG
jgi:hypothetical protein